MILRNNYHTNKTYLAMIVFFFQLKKSFKGANLISGLMNHTKTEKGKMFDKNVFSMYKTFYVNQKSSVKFIEILYRTSTSVKVDANIALHLMYQLSHAYIKSNINSYSLNMRY